MLLCMRVEVTLRGSTLRRLAVVLQDDLESLAGVVFAFFDTEPLIDHRRCRAGLIGSREPRYQSGCEGLRGTPRRDSCVNAETQGPGTEPGDALNDDGRGYRGRRRA